MDEKRLRALEVRALANEQLIKALIALLAIREEVLMEELETVFVLVDRLPEAEKSLEPRAAEVQAIVKEDLRFLHTLVRRCEGAA